MAGARPWDDPVTTTSPAPVAGLPMNLELNAALGSLKAGMDMLRGAVAARDDAKAQAALQDMSGQLTDALMSALAGAEKAVALQSQLAELQAQLRDAQERQQQRERYVLRELRPGVFVRSAKASDDGSTPAHDVCQACFGDSGKVISVLQRSLDGAVLCCQLDSAHNLRIQAYAPVGVGRRSDW